MKLHEVIYGVVLVVAILGLTFWINKDKDIYRYDYVTTYVDEVTQRNYLTLQGRIINEAKVPHYAIGEGVVTKLLVEVGDQVVEGQVIAILDNEQINFDEIENLKATRNRIYSDMKVGKSLDEYEKLYKAGFYSNIEFEEYKSQLLRTVSGLHSFDERIKDAQERIRSKALISNVTGVVAQMNFELNHKIKRSQLGLPLFYINRDGKDDWKVAFEIPDDTRSLVKEGSPFTIEAFRLEEVVKGSITSIDTIKTFYRSEENKVIANGYFMAKGNLSLDSFEEINSHFRSDMNVVANVEIGENKNFTWIPKAAFDLIIPRGLIVNEIDYSQLASEKVAGALAGTAEKVEQKDRGVIMRGVASESFPLTYDVKVLYILDGDKNITKVKVNSIAENSDFVAIPKGLLSNQRVVLHYRKVLDL